MQGRVDFAIDIAFKTADDLAPAQSLSGATKHVSLGAVIIAKPCPDDATESSIRLAVASAV